MQNRFEMRCTYFYAKILFFVSLYVCVYVFDVIIGNKTTCNNSLQFIELGWLISIYSNIYSSHWEYLIRFDLLSCNIKFLSLLFFKFRVLVDRIYIDILKTDTHTHIHRKTFLLLEVKLENNDSKRNAKTKNSIPK